MHYNQLRNNSSWKYVNHFDIENIIYDTITKCNNFIYLQQIIFIYVLNCS